MVAAGAEDFMKLTHKIPEKFESKPRKLQPFIFAGEKINKGPEDYYWNIVRTTTK